MDIRVFATVQYIHYWAFNNPFVRSLRWGIHNSVTGNRTLVISVTGRYTNHYTITDACSTADFGRVMTDSACEFTVTLKLGLNEVSSDIASKWVWISWYVPGTLGVIRVSRGSILGEPLLFLWQRHYRKFWGTTGGLRFAAVCRDTFFSCTRWAEEEHRSFHACACLAIHQRRGVVPYSNNLQSWGRIDSLCTQAFHESGICYLVYLASSRSRVWILALHIGSECRKFARFLQ